MTRLRRKRVYSYAVEEAASARIPSKLIEEMARLGWNIFGIYEVVADELRKEKRQKKGK